VAKNPKFCEKSKISLRPEFWYASFSVLRATDFTSTKTVLRPVRLDQ